LVHTPALCRGLAEALDDADGLVARDELISGSHHAGELFVVCSAKPACFDPEEAIVVSDLGHRHRAAKEVPGPFENQRRSFHEG
jgi:hypothetical protein